jgi:hypothetical protein
MLKFSFARSAILAGSVVERHSRSPKIRSFDHDGSSLLSRVQRHRPGYAEISIFVDHFVIFGSHDRAVGCIDVIGLSTSQKTAIQHCSRRSDGRGSAMPPPATASS